MNHQVNTGNARLLHRDIWPPGGHWSMVIGQLRVKERGFYSNEGSDY
jgi:hypothetical protein